MTYAFTFTIPRLPNLKLAQKRCHWSAHHKEAVIWRAEMITATRFYRPTAPLRRARIALTLLNSIQPDYENLCFAFKAPVDALCRSTPQIARANVLWDDKPAMLERHYSWEQAPRGKGGIRVRVEELAADSEG